jgi:hypothetical protein
MKGTNVVSKAEATPARIAARKAFDRQSHLMLKRTRQSKLTPAQRYEAGVRYSEGEDPKELALEYGISAGWVRSLGSR